MGDDKTLFLFVFRDEYLTTDSPSTEQERKSVLAKVFADVGWECPRILAALAKVDSIYFDRVSQIRLDRWTKGRTALVGDAGACVSLMTGEGAGLAMAEAYVLAGELRICGSDYAAAFVRYQERMMPFLIWTTWPVVDDGGRGVELAACRRFARLAARVGCKEPPPSQLAQHTEVIFLPGSPRRVGPTRAKRCRKNRVRSGNCGGKGRLCAFTSILWREKLFQFASTSIHP